MKALFLVDLYQMWNNFKFYGAFIVVAIGITAFSGPGEGNLGVFFPMYAVFMCSMMSMSLLQLDEASRWNVCAQALPCTRRDQVTDKYAVTLISFGVTWVLFVLLYAVLAAMGRLAWQMMAVQSILLLVMGLLAPAVSLPTLFRWGSAKGRVIYLAMVILLAAGIGGMLAGLAELDRVIDLPELSLSLIAALAVLVPIALFAGSWALSVRWYEKREL